MLARDRERIRVDGDAAPALADPPDGLGEHHPPAERLRRADRDELRAADEAAVLGSARGIDQPLDRPGRALIARGVDVEEHVQQRDVPRLAGEHGLDREVEQAVGTRAETLRAFEALERLAVPVLGAWRRPGCAERHGLGHAVELVQQRLELRIGRQVRRDRPERSRRRVRRELAALVEQVVAVVVGLEGLHPEFAGQLREVILRRPDPLAADLDDLAGVGGAQSMVQRPATDAIAGLEHDHRAPGRVELARGREAREAGADDDHIGPQRGASWTARRRPLLAGSAAAPAAARGAADQSAPADPPIRGTGHVWAPFVRGAGHILAMI